MGRVSFIFTRRSPVHTLFIFTLGTTGLRFWFDRLAQTSADGKRMYAYTGSVYLVRVSDFQPQIYASERQWSEQGREVV